ncbi:MAG TPA: hypothetical protein VJV79_18175 [Polyangiaceae bacterium]|nr:hypothetical protein [Polyangiaceae bacterium]
MTAAQRWSASSVVLGESFGCAQFSSGSSTRWQCWDAPRAGDVGPIKAWPVPWLDDRLELQAAPDRLCEFASQALTYRCWAPPQRTDLVGRDLPAHWQWTNPNHATFGEAYTRADRLGSVAQGGSFACLQATTDGVWCLGDDRFGQLGGSLPVPPPEATAEDPAFVPHIWPVHHLATGTWHACVLTDEQSTIKDDPYIACWGRGDYGQLGFKAPDRCLVEGVNVPCAKSPRRGISLKNSVAVPLAGDLFSCVSSEAGIKCWGANRDAFFGTPGSCPASLRKAWPTLHGSVPAPRAACSATPVAVPKLTGFHQSPAVGPRGICIQEADQLKCWGALHAPRGPRVSQLAVNPGQHANACGLRGGTRVLVRPSTIETAAIHDTLDASVVCWGEGYSAPSTPDVPVTVEFTPFEPASETAVVRSSNWAGPWSARCMIQRPCQFGTRQTQQCTSNLVPKNWDELLASPERYAGQVVSVRGRIERGEGRTTHAACPGKDGRGCCNRVESPVLLAGKSPLLLGGLSCQGDDSQQCCNAPAFGQTLVATGRLRTGDHPHSELWVLDDPVLCLEAPP